MTTGLTMVIASMGAIDSGSATDNLVVLASATACMPQYTWQSQGLMYCGMQAMYIGVWTTYLAIFGVGLNGSDHSHCSCVGHYMSDMLIWCS